MHEILRNQHTLHQLTAPKTGTTKIFSKCGNKEHACRECKETTKKYINCAGKHRSLVSNCPMRKKVREEKTMEKKKNNKIKHENH